MQTTKGFQKNKEDFVCENCGEENIGTGYTNHCKKCLLSKHVDINPGDRKEKCCGMMAPSKIDLEKWEYVITHKCQKCGFERRKFLDKEDDFNSVLAIVKNGDF